MYKKLHFLWDRASKKIGIIEYSVVLNYYKINFVWCCSLEHTKAVVRTGKGS